MATYDSEEVTNKPKLTPIKIIKKFMITYDIKLKGNPPIYYAWETKRQPKWYEDDNGIYPDKPYFTIDYDKNNGEWYIGYIVDIDNRKFARIDDITGRCDIQT
jgi:hypothetical protein